ncbi:MULTISPECIES: LysR family transcriptional regulator [Alcaligenaceae]|nr:LysR family transcriptional regulator [Eoetvoesiella caeni]MCI2810359.1 LysR family transcriptional regulator [Eoetvoesiella caeni]NYT54728.1 LysR family transcriptional regulator [Eoetvoesiella caeni]
MELRHLRCFIALAEELHFTRAAERLHIEQSPLSRSIKELEDELGVVLFDRNRRGTLLTSAGTTFLQDVRRIFIILEQARDNVTAVAAGFRGSIRIAISDGAVGPQLSEFLALCRKEDPDVEIRMSEMPLAEQLRGLRSGDVAIGFAHTADVGGDIIAEPVWREPLVLIVPARHPLLVYRDVPLHELKHYPLVLCDPQMCEGYSRELERLLRPLEVEPNVVEHVSSLDMMLTLVSAGYGIGFTTSTRFGLCRRSEVVIRPLAGDSAVMTTYLLRHANTDLSALLDRFIFRLRACATDQGYSLTQT